MHQHRSSLGKPLGSNSAYKTLKDFYGQIQQWLATELKLNIAYKTVYQLVRYRLNAKLKVPRPQSLKQHPESQSHFKKTSLALKFLQSELRERLRYLCHETRLGLKTIDV